VWGDFGAIGARVTDQLRDCAKSLKLIHLNGSIFFLCVRRDKMLSIFIQPYHDYNNHAKTIDVSISTFFVGFLQG
jgi:hypothetical protein